MIHPVSFSNNEFAQPLPYFCLASVKARLALKISISRWGRIRANALSKTKMLRNALLSSD
jgi:hypothetical protein